MHDGSREDRITNETNTSCSTTGITMESAQTGAHHRRIRVEHYSTVLFMGTSDPCSHSENPKDIDEVLGTLVGFST